MKKQKKKFSLKKQYKLSFDYMRECKNFIWIVLGIFFAFALIGYFVPAPSELVNEIMKFIEEILRQTEGMSQERLIGFIFGFALGIFPLIAVIANGYLLGFVAKASVQQAGILSLWKIFPHGIFELPAVFISLAMGLKFGTFVFQKEKINSFNQFLFEGLRVFIFIVIPLLIVAGIIEGSLIFWISG